MENNSLFKAKITGVSAFVVVLLVLVLLGLGERVFYDLSRVFGTHIDYFNDIASIIAHTIFTVVLLAIAVLINVSVSEKREKYAVAIIPYFLVSVVLTIQVVLEAGVYFYGHHTTFQFYLVMSALVIILSALIYVVQKHYSPRDVEGSGAAAAVSHHGPLFWIIIVILGFWFLQYFFSSIF